MNDLAKLLTLFTLLMQISQFAFSALTPEQIQRRQISFEHVLAQPLPFAPLPTQDDSLTLFTMHGSNTIGGSLGPSLAMAYLQAKGAQHVMVQPLKQANEKMVSGVLIDQGKTVQIKIAAHGSSTGFQGLMSGEAQIWAASRAVKSKEVDLALAHGDLRSPEAEHIVGIDGLAIVVNPANGLNQISKQQLALIYSGQLRNWSQLGGKDLPINLYARDENSGTWDSFKNMVLGKSLTLWGEAKRFESSERLVQQVMADPAGIGFIGLGFVADSKLLAISDGAARGFKPSPLTVATEDYALSRRLFLYSQQQDHAYVQEFLRFAQGLQGQKIVREQGFISQNVKAMSGVLSAELPEDYLQLVTGAKRLSTNFRFQPGSAKLDNKALKDIQRLAYFMHQHHQTQPNARLILIGFADKRKVASRSKLLSKLRAMAVRRELARLGIHPSDTRGYGEFNAVASATEDGGYSRVKNSRVEVWVR